MADRFRYLNLGLGVILAFVGVKMLLVEVVHLPTWVSLAVIAVVLTITILTSLRAERRDPRPATAGPTPWPSPHDEPNDARGTWSRRARSTRDPCRWRRSAVGRAAESGRERMS